MSRIEVYTVHVTQERSGVVLVAAESEAAAERLVGGLIDDIFRDSDTRTRGRFSATVLRGYAGDRSGESPWRTDAARAEVGDTRCITAAEWTARRGAP